MIVSLTMIKIRSRKQEAGDHNSVIFNLCAFELQSGKKRGLLYVCLLLAMSKE